MTLEEAKKAIAELKAQGKDDMEILGGIYLMFADGTIRLEDLRTFTELMGYEFTDEFEAMSDEDKKKKGYEFTDDAAEGVEKEDVEKAKEFGDDKGETADSNPKPSKSDKPEDDEREKAKKLFGLA